MARRFKFGLVALGFGGLAALVAWQLPRPPIVAVEPPVAPEPDGLIARIGDGRLRHCGNVLRTLFHPNGKWVAATASGENGARLWDTDTGEQVRRFTDRHLDPIENRRSGCSVLLFTPDGRLVVGTDDGRVVAFHLDTGAVTARFMADGFSGWSLGVSPTGRHAGGFDPDRRLAAWNLDTGDQVFVGPKCDGRKVFWGQHGSVCFSPDGKSIAICKLSDTVWYAPLSDAAAGREVSAAAAARGADGLLDLEWSANNRLVAHGHGGSVVIDTDAGKVLSHDETVRQLVASRYVQNRLGTRAVETRSHAVRVIDLTSRSIPDYALPELDRQAADPLTDLSTSADGTRLLMGDGVWDISDDRPKLLRELRLGQDLRHTRLSPDGRFVVSTHRGWLDVASGQDVFLESPRAAEDPSVVVSAGGVAANSVWVRHYETHVLREITLPSGKALGTYAGLGEITHACVSRDGKHVAVGGYETFAVRAADPWVKWQVLEKYPAKPPACKPPPPPCPHDFAFHPDGRLFALRDHRLITWPGSPPQMGTATERAFDREHKPVALAMSPDGRRLAVVTDSREATRSEVRVFDTATLDEAYRLSPGNGVSACTFTADGRLVVAHRDATVSIWSAERLDAKAARK